MTPRDLEGGEGVPTSDRKAFAATTGIARLGVLEDEAASFESGLEVEGDAAQVDRALAIEKDLEAFEVDDGVAFLFRGESEVVAQARAPAALDAKA